MWYTGTFKSERHKRSLEEKWVSQAREIILSDDRIVDKTYTWACVMNTLSQKGFITMRMEHMPLYPDKVDKRIPNYWK